MSGIHDLASRLLHTVDPEEAHGLTIKGLKYGLGPRPVEADDPILATSLAGLALPNCIGLAAGFDKNAEAPNAMLRAGFGFVECGTVTPLAQEGNARPRLFRLSEDRAVISTEDMVSAPEGKAYELWFIDGDTFTSAGLMPDVEDQTVVLEGSARDASAVGITVEPESGSEQPTTEPIAVFDLTEAT